MISFHRVGMSILAGNTLKINFYINMIFISQQAHLLPVFAFLNRDGNR